MSVSDMGADTSEADMFDAFVRPGPQLLEMTEEEARAAWATPVSPQIVDGEVFIGTDRPLAAVVEVSSSSLEGYVSLRQAPNAGNEIAGLEAFVVTGSAIFATTGLEQVGEGVWFWTIDRESMSVEGALWIEGCVPTGADQPMGYDNEIVFVPCSTGVVTVDVSSFKRPEISRVWEASQINHVRLATAENGRQSFMVVQFGGVKFVTLTEFGMTSTSEYELPETHRPLYGSVRYGDDVWILSGNRVGRTGEDTPFPARSPQAVLTGLRVGTLGVEAFEEIYLDEALETVGQDVRMNHNFWYDGENTVVLPLAQNGERFTYRLVVVDLSTSPPTAEEIDISSPEDGYTGVTSMLRLGDDLLLFRGSLATRAPPFQRIPLGDLGIQ